MDWRRGGAAGSERRQKRRGKWLNQEVVENVLSYLLYSQLPCPEMPP